MFEDDPQLAAFAQDLRAAAAAVPAPAAGDDLAAVLAGTAPAPAPVWLPAHRRSRRSITIRATIAGAVFGLGVGSLGVAGALPAPLQRGLSHAGEVVGVHLPEPAADHGPPASTPGQQQRQEQLEKHVPTSTPVRHGDVGDDVHETPTTANDGGHRGATDDPNARGDEERNEHATTTTTLDGDRGEDGRGASGSHVTGVTPTTIDHRGGDDARSSSGAGDSSGR
jgi:hypothetical protein